MRRAFAILVAASLLAAVLPLATGAADRARAAGASEARIYLGDPTTLDPAAASDSTSSGVIVQLFERLTALDSELVVRPALAERWELQDGGRRIVFTLREGLTFSDGTPLAAADVVRSWLRLLDPRNPGPFATFLLDVEGARAYVNGESTDPASVGLVADGQTLEVRFTRPAGDFPSVAASASLAVVPPAVGRDPGALEAGDGFVASGGYRLVSRSSTELGLEANPRYWAGRPAIEKIVGVASLEGRSPVDLYTAGELDWTPIGSYDADWISYDRELGPSLRSSDSFTTFYYGFTTTKAPFDDARVRRAFAQAGRLAPGGRPWPTGRTRPPRPAWSRPGSRAGARATSCRPSTRRPPGRSWPRRASRAGPGSRRSPWSPREATTRASSPSSRPNLGVPRRLRGHGFRRVLPAPLRRPAGDVGLELDGRLPGTERLPGHPAGQRRDQQLRPLVERGIRRRRGGRPGDG